MEQEIWKLVFIDYAVSSLGRVKSLKFGKDIILKQQNTSNGYLFVNLSYRKERVHRLVAKAFLGLDLDIKGLVVCHKDDNKHNNRVENLFIGRQSDNMADMNNKLRGKEKVVLQFTKEGEFIKEWKSTIYIERILGILNSQISGCCRGVYGFKTAGGFIWKYK